MNELIKVVTDEKNEKVVSARELNWDELLKECDNFEDFFCKLYNLSLQLEKDKLKDLIEFIDKFDEKYSRTSIVYLKDMILCESLLPCKFKEHIRFTEKEMKEFVLKNFDLLFPDYYNPKKEVVVKNNTGRIDIVALEIGSDRPVIIELKTNLHSPNKQLIAYGEAYENPILIAITENEVSNKNDRIEYVIFNTLLDIVNKESVSN